MKKLSLLVLSCLLFAIACKKPSETDKSKSFGFMNGTSNVSMPYVENGMLVFKDMAAYYAYIAYLDDVTTNLSDNQEKLYESEENDPHEIILDSIEASLGFSSLRALYYEKFMTENLTGWTKVEDAPTYYTASKSAEQSTLNQDGEVKIGDKVKKVMSDDYEIFIETQDATIYSHLLNQAREIKFNYPNGNIPLEVLRSLDYTSRYLHIIDLSTSDRVFEPLDDEPIGGYAISGVIQYGNFCYGSFNEMTLKSFTLVNVTSWFNGQPGGSPVVAYYDINFGNGVSVNNVIGNQGNFGISFDKMYVYQAPGTYTVTVKAKLSLTGPYVATKNYTVNIAGGTAVCTSDRKERIVNYSVNSTHVLQCKIEYWRSSHIPFFWMKQTNGIADVKHFEKVGNVWKVKKHKLWIAVRSIGYKDDNSCDVHPDVPLSTQYNVRNWLEFNTARYVRSTWTGRKGYGLLVKFNNIEADFGMFTNEILSDVKTYYLSACD